jgi:trehalose 6-phosphate phosphatase
MVRPVMLNERTHADCALFLDVDGTLLEIAETPQSVHVPEKLKTLLIRLSINLDGAVALVSGRSLHDIDRLFSPLRPCASGVHGCERRGAWGKVVRATLDRRLLDPARAELETFVRRYPGLLLEDKGHALALHFRRIPHLSPEVHDVMAGVQMRVGTAFVLQRGKCVFELRPAAWSKGVAITQFMSEPPFAGRKPIFVGDDLTDEHGFAVVNALGGISIRVGEATVTMAQQRVRCVSDLIKWLERLALSGQFDELIDGTGHTHHAR